MSRADEYGAFSRESRARLVHQVYAYVGDPEVARRAVEDALVSARHHWRKLQASPDRDAWLRARAFEATGRAQNRSRQPWYVSAKRTSDDNRPLLAALSRLTPMDRRLVIVRYLAGLDIPDAGREVGLSEDAAEASLRASAAAFERRGLDASPAAIAARLDRLRGDLHDEPVDPGGSWGRESSGRRSTYLVLAALAVVGIAVGAAALTADRPDGQQGTPSQPAPEASAPAPPEDPFSTRSLTSAASLRTLDRQESWVVGETSTDFGQNRAVDDCLAATAVEPGLRHSWTRDFTTAVGDDPARATEALTVADSAAGAGQVYTVLVDAFASCQSGHDQVAAYRTIERLGDEASVFTLRFVEGTDVGDKQVAIARSGNTVVTWIVRGSSRHPMTPTTASKLTGLSISAMCDDSSGACAKPPYRLEETRPPPVGSAPGFLATVDLPVFPPVRQPWVATDPARVKDNPAATACDRADFSRGGAEGVSARSYVIPDATQLGPVFGVSETIGGFPSSAAAKRFTVGVIRAVDACPDRQANLSVLRSDDLRQGPVRGRVWQIEVATSANKSFVFRVALLLVDETVAEVTFTPTGDFDVDHERYVALATRAAQRLKQP